MSSPSNTLRVGIVGAGENTRSKHIPLLRALAGVEIAAVANRSRESAERVAGEFGIPRVYDQWEHLVSAADLDAVVIGTWPNLHCPVTVAALDAGKHVLCEARMALDAAEARRMCDAAARHPELVAQLVPSPFTLHADRTIQRLLREGFLGRLLAAEIHVKNGQFADPEPPLHWRQDVACSGVNTMSLGIWYEALMRWVGEATDVFARGLVAVPERRDAETGQLATVRVPEHLVATSAMACGAQAAFLFSTVAGGVRINEALLFGTEGTLGFSNGKLHGMRRGETSMSELAIPTEEGVGWRVEADFVDAIRGCGKVERTTFADGLHYMVFTEAVARSLAEGRRVDLSEV